MRLLGRITKVIEDARAYSDDTHLTYNPLHWEVMSDTQDRKSVV